MLRYVISFPGDIRQDQLHAIREELAYIADTKEWRDVVLAHGGTITDMRRRNPVLTSRRRAVGARVR